MARSLRKQWFISAFIGTVLTLGSVFIIQCKILETLTYDARFIQRSNREPSTKIVCVGIDENSFALFKGIDPKMATWPWSPTLFAQAIDNLNEWGAKVIAIDKLFAEPDIRPEPAPGTTAEDVMAEAIKRHGNVILACKQEAEVFTDEEGRRIRIKTFVGPSSSGETEVLMEACRLGSINVALDPDNGLRWVPLQFEHQGEEIPSFARVIAEAFLNLPPEASERISEREFRIGDRIIPLNDAGRMAINFTGTRLPMVPLAYVWMGDAETMEFAGYDPAMFQDAVVLIGAWTTDLHDLYRVPHCRVAGFSDGHLIPGVEIQAQAVNTILSNEFLKPIPIDYRCIISAACGLFVTLCGATLSVQAGIAVLLISIVTYGGGAFWAFSAHNLILPVAHPLITMFLAGAGVSSYRYVRESIEKKFLKDIFSKQTDQKLVDLIIDNPSLVQLGGEDREATILFSDIRSYSTMSEGMQPAELIDLLNEYFSAWTEVIFRNNGMIDKYIGDAVMAVFGAPVANDTHAYDACKAAVEMIRELERLCGKWESEGRKTFRIGIGIHTGHAVFGNLGSEERFSYTCIGDAVNIASRIEGINKKHGTSILISEDTYTRVKDLVIAESKGQNEIRGRTATIELFELIDVKKREALQD